MQKQPFKTFFMILMQTETAEYSEHKNVSVFVWFLMGLSNLLSSTPLYYNVTSISKVESTLYKIGISKMFQGNNQLCEELYKIESHKMAGLHILNLCKMSADWLKDRLEGIFTDFI